MSIPECPVCRVTMEEGHVLEHDSSNRLGRVRWTEGPPEKALLYGHKVKGRRHFETITYRCPRCGWLLWFAPEPAS